ncbi:methionyl-tRNA formyltransferase [Sphingomonas alba]|uniref:Methionyl-tRNA formyltransferase n=1 Tax=Sphingomonas alba TaxID=2908208 RepID=A0ABT0RIJ5_9SPHN|nr:methionyl-tRNA formyltransferase [Sphingomonas alba]MCL6682420.1 methionyl-tRNA formyltransferase [Sphingomonas alba]
MRVIFMGSPDFAVPTLYALQAAKHEVAAVYCQPPRAAGRGKAIQPTPVQRAAELMGIPVHSPVSLKGAAEQEEFEALRAEFAVVAAYGLILPKPILAAPKLGCLNVHGSLLPRWRGAAPVQRAIMAGDAITGVTIMEMEAGLDTGPMLAAQEFAIGNRNAGEVTKELSVIGAQLMMQVLSDFDSYPHVAQPEEGVTYAAKIRKEEARIDWAFPALQVLHQVRGLAPFPGAWFEANGERVKLLDAQVVDGDGKAGEVLDDGLTIACGEAALRPLLVQRAGKGAMTPDELLRGFPVSKGTILP